MQQVNTFPSAGQHCADTLGFVAWRRSDVRSGDVLEENTIRAEVS